MVALPPSTSAVTMSESGNIDYYKSVFIDEACLTFYRSKCRSVNITIFGAFTGDGVVNLSFIRPQKKSKFRGSDFIEFLEALLKALKENGMTGRYLVMDNAFIHRTQKVKDIVDKEGFHIHYLPYHSSFLNPIEGLWSKLNADVKYNFKKSENT